MTLNRLMNSSDFGESIIPQIDPQYDRESGKWFSKEDTNLKPVQWSMIALNNFKESSKTYTSLPNGKYEINEDERDGKPIYIKKDIVHDDLIPLLGLPSDVVKEIDEFWTKEKLFSNLGFLHRRGYLFYGSHGSGKSSLVQQITDKTNDSIVFYCENPKHFNKGLQKFRQVEPNRKIICIFEDIDAIVRKYGESDLLSVLDGENQVSGVVNIATTNYPELLDKRIVGRPRRFDRVYKIENLDDTARKHFLKIKLPKTEDVSLWTKKTQGLTIASISEVIISVLCFDKSLDEAIEIVTSLAKNKSSDEYRDTDEIGL